MAQYQLDPNEVARRAKAAEHRTVAEFLGRGFGWEPLDVERSLSRPEGCILEHPNGKRLCVAEVKRVESGGVGVPVEGPPAPALLSDLDARLPDGRVRCFPAIPPAVSRDLNHARKKYRELAKDRPEFDGLPYIVVFDHSAYARLGLVDRRMPKHREISGLLFFERGRLHREALEALPMDEFERRMEEEERDFSGLPAEDEIEWRLVPNPYALRPVPAVLRGICLVGWPNDPPWPDHLPREIEEEARRTLAALLRGERLVLEGAYFLFGRIDVARHEHAAGKPFLDRLVARGLATRKTATEYVLTSKGLALGLVLDLDRRARDDVDDAPIS